MPLEAYEKYWPFITNVWNISGKTKGVIGPQTFYYRCLLYSKTTRVSEGRGQRSKNTRVAIGCGARLCVVIDTAAQLVILKPSKVHDPHNHDLDIVDNVRQS